MAAEWIHHPRASHLGLFGSSRALRLLLHSRGCVRRPLPGLFSPVAPISGDGLPELHFRLSGGVGHARGLGRGALYFLCFGWATTAAVGSIAAQGITYFFGGMAAGLEGRRRSLAGGMENEREAEGGSGRKRREKGFLSPTERPDAAFRFCRRAQATPGRLGSGRDRRLWISPKPALNEILGHD